jgi:hypothetical protein
MRQQTCQQAKAKRTLKSSDHNRVSPMVYCYSLFALPRVRKTGGILAAKAWIVTGSWRGENGLGDSQFHNARVYLRRRAEHCSFGFFDHAASQAAGTV